MASTTGTTPDDTEKGAYALHPRRRRSGVRQALLALIVLALLAAGAFALLRNMGDEGDRSGFDLDDDPDVATLQSLPKSLSASLTTSTFTLRGTPGWL